MSGDPHERLSSTVRALMRGAEPGSVDVVIAVAALLARVAFADRRYAAVEGERVRQELMQVLGFGEEQVRAVHAALGADLAGIAQAPLDRYTDVLRERLDLHMREDVVKMLIDLAAADREVADSEVGVIRAVAAQLLVDEALLQALLQRARGQRAT